MTPDRSRPLPSPAGEVAFPVGRIVPGVVKFAHGGLNHAVRRLQDMHRRELELATS